jgi:hypothetical protein
MQLESTTKTIKWCQFGGLLDQVYMIKKDGQHYKRLLTSQEEFDKGGHGKQTWQKTKRGGNMFDQVMTRRWPSTLEEDEHDQKRNLNKVEGRTWP